MVEILYPAMEDYQLDISLIEEGPAARSIKIDTAAVYSDRCHHPCQELSGIRRCRDRFGIVQRLELIIRMICSMCQPGARYMGLDISDDGARQIAMRSRGAPRIITDLLRGCGFCPVKGVTAVLRQAGAGQALDMLNVDSAGLITGSPSCWSIIDKFMGGRSGWIITGERPSVKAGKPLRMLSEP